MASINVGSITRHFEGTARPAMNALNFDVAPGEFMAILGPSGCGKTTALRSIAGLETPDAGSIRIDGEVVFDSASGTNLPPERRRLGMVFQSYAVWPHMTVADNITYPLRIRKVPSAQVREELEGILKLVDLGGLEDRYPGQLSGGQQQRVAVARALVGQPRALLFDEPLSNLDAKLREHMRVELLELQRRLKFTALYVTHDQEEAMAMSDRILVMSQGNVEQIGTPLEVYERPQSTFVADFLGAINFIPATLLGREGGGARVDSPLGQLTVAAEGIRDDTLATGAEVTVAVRPHCIELARTAAGNGVVRQLIRLGSRSMLLIECGPVTIRADTVGNADWSSGETCHVSFPPDRCQLFPAVRMAPRRRLEQENT